MRYVAFLKQQNHIVFLGDSRIRQLYNAIVKQVHYFALIRLSFWSLP